MIVTSVCAATAVVVTGNVPLSAPVGIVIDAGMLAAALPLVSSTRAPSLPAGARRVTVPVVVRPPVSSFDARATLATPMSFGSAPMTTSFDSIGYECRSRARTVIGSPGAPVTGTRNEPSAATFACTLGAGRAFVTYSTPLISLYAPTS